MVCSTGNSVRYRRLSTKVSEELLAVESSDETLISGYDSDSDLVALKISILGDCQIGKTSFVVSFMINLINLFFYNLFYLIVRYSRL